MTYDELLEKVKADHATAEQVNAAGGIREEVTQSDKLGYDWHIYYVNDVAVRKDYVEQEVPYGTAKIHVGTTALGDNTATATMTLTAGTTSSLDISSITGSKYISIYVQSSGGTYGNSIGIAIDKVWLE